MENPTFLLAKKRIIMLTSPPKKVGGIFQFPKPHLATLIHFFTQENP
jgi:hypothetical protein